MNPLLYQTYRQPGQTVAIGTPPGNTMICQYRLGNTITLKSRHQTTVNGMTGLTIQSKDAQSETTVVVDDTKRIAATLTEGIVALEIHLPQLIGMLSCKPTGGLTFDATNLNQTMPLEHTIDCTLTNSDSLFSQQ